MHTDAPIATWRDNTVFRHCHPPGQGIREKRRRTIAGSELGIDIDADSDSFSISEHCLDMLGDGRIVRVSADEEASDSSSN